MASRNLPVLQPRRRGLEWRDVEAYNPAHRFGFSREVFMKRHAFASALAAVCVLVFSSAAFAQAKPGAQAPALEAAPGTAPPPPATPPKFTTKVKGKGEIQGL